MKCPNCASDVPDNSNFCGVCGTDIRAHRAQAANETLVIDSETRAAMFESAKKHAAPESIPEASVDEDSMSSTMVDVKQPIAPQGTADSQSEDAIARTAKPEQTAQPATPASQQQVAAQAPAPTAQPAPKKQSKEVVIETSANLPVSEAAKTPEPVSSGADKDGGFRETLWFMQAQNPESIEAIDNVDVRHLADSYEDKGNAMDTQLRQQFSLNVSDEPVPVPKPQTFDTQAFQGIDIPGVSKKGKYAATIALVAALGAAAWFFLR